MWKLTSPLAERHELAGTHARVPQQARHHRRALVIGLPGVEHRQQLLDLGGREPLVPQPAGEGPQAAGTLVQRGRRQAPTHPVRHARVARLALQVHEVAARPKASGSASRSTDCWAVRCATPSRPTPACWAIRSSPTASPPARARSWTPAFPPPSGSCATGRTTANRAPGQTWSWRAWCGQPWAMTSR